MGVLAVCLDYELYARPNTRWFARASGVPSGRPNSASALEPECLAARSRSRAEGVSPIELLQTLDARLRSETGIAEVDPREIADGLQVGGI